MGRYWNTEEDNLLRELIAQYGKQWSVIATHIPNRTATQIAARWEKCINPKLTKGPFSADEDRTIIEFVEQHGCHAWPKITSVLPHRTPKQCRERWFNNLDPNVTKSPWTPEEDELIFENYMKFGPKWSTIAHMIPGRTDNSIKNRWNASISKRVKVDADGKQSLIPCKVRKYSKKNRVEQARPSQLQIMAKTNGQNYPIPENSNRVPIDSFSSSSSDLSDAPSQSSVNSSPLPEFPLITGKPKASGLPPLIIPQHTLGFEFDSHADFDADSVGFESLRPDFNQPFDCVNCGSLIDDMPDGLLSPTTFQIGLHSPHLFSPTMAVPIFDDF